MGRSKHFTNVTLIAQLIDPFGAVNSVPMVLNQSTNWDNMVKIASQHLVLPTIYSQLKKKKFLSLLPDDLVHYLDTLSRLNRDRNVALIKQIHEVNSILKKNNIPAIFVKGAALLVCEGLNDIGERMVGDIDVLIKAHQCQFAYKLLKNYEYYDLTTASIGMKHFGDTGRHLPRLRHNSRPAAVEIHHKLLRKDKFSLLHPQSVWDEAQLVNGILIPSGIHLFQHAILNWEINDFGSNNKTLSLRSAYDALILMKHYNYTIILKEQYKIKPIRNFLQKCAVIIPDNQLLLGLQTQGFIGLQYAFHLNCSICHYVNKGCHGLLRFSILLINRIARFGVDKAYRDDILNNPSYVLKASLSVFLKMVMGKPKQFK